MSNQPAAESDPVEPLGPDKHIELARKLYAAWLSEQQGVSIAYAYSRHAAGSDPGPLWLGLAAFVSDAVRGQVEKDLGG